jgi:hypothetical protein
VQHVAPKARLLNGERNQGVFDLPAASRSSGPASWGRMPAKSRTRRSLRASPSAGAVTRTHGKIGFRSGKVEVERPRVWGFCVASRFQRWAGLRISFAALSALPSSHLAQPAADRSARVQRLRQPSHDVASLDVASLVILATPFGVWRA